MTDAGRTAGRRSALRSTTSTWPRGARMIEFAGFAMPVEYSGIIAEHKTVRSAAGSVRLVAHGRDFRSPAPARPPLSTGPSPTTSPT